MSLRRGTGARARRPNREPTIAASCTIGPSRPIDPPEAIESSEDALFTSVDRTPMRPSPTRITSM